MFYFGVDYYPEHWPEERWPIDAKMQAEAGFNVVRLAEFAWSRMEPDDGRFDFAWLDRAIEVLAAQGIKIVLGTPTASPPPWLMAKHPDAYRVNENGQRWTYGNRREYCPNNTAYADYTRRIVTKMAEHYAANPAVIGWQTDNEFGDRCYCPVCAQAFQAWLLRKYETLENLNTQWGTVFWSHEYTDWAQIPLPLTTCRSANPGLWLDFYRFSSDSYVAYQRIHTDILRTVCPTHFMTHNLMGFKYDRINYFDLAKDLDFVSWDNYPRTQWGMGSEMDPSRMALSGDTMRGLLHKNIWVMEQQAGPGGWEIVSAMPRPGELRLWAYQQIAHGADAIVFFRWRTARFGTEEYWHGLLQHDGRPTRRYDEIKRMGEELKRAGEQIAGATLKPSIAIVLDYDSRFAFQIQPNSPSFGYPEHIQSIYRALFHKNAPVEIVSPTDDLSKYKLVFAPALHLLTEARARNLRSFVQGGGVLVCTPRTGVKDEYNTVVNMPLPGLLADVFGVSVDDYDSLPDGAGQPLQFSANITGQGAARGWCDVITPSAAEVVATYTQEYYAGQPAITLNKVGQGKAVYIGTFGDDALYESLAPWLFELAGVRGVTTTPRGIEVTERWQGDRRLLFVLNHTNSPKDAHLRRVYVNILNEQVLQGTVSVGPHDVLVLTEQRE
jgi:beta-galactosidase